MKITKQDVGRSYVGRNGNIYTITKYNSNRQNPFIICSDGGLIEAIDENGYLFSENSPTCIDFVRWLDDKKDEIINEDEAKIKELESYSRNITLVAIAGWIIAFCFLLTLV